jgi:hypothetical protein
MDPTQSSKLLRVLKARVATLEGLKQVLQVQLKQNLARDILAPI